MDDIVSLYTADAENQELVRRVTELPALPKGWRDYFRKRLGILTLEYSGNERPNRQFQGQPAALCLPVAGP